MSEEQRKMIDTKNAVEDRYDLCKRLLVALNSDNIDEAKSILKEEMQVYEEDYLYIDEEKEPSIIVGTEE